MPAKVVMLSSTVSATDVVATAAHRCVSLDEASNYMYRLTEDKSVAVIRCALSMGHTSILEHASFTFDISRISRVLSHQLVRFRIASYSQLSQRYCKGPFGFVTPPSVEKDHAFHELYLDIMSRIEQVYQCGIDRGIPAEDARFVLPNACETALVMTMNARELNHAFNLRCCTHAQWEIRDMFNKILDIVKRREPLLFENAGASCVGGYCPEGSRSCAKMVSRDAKVRAGSPAGSGGTQ